VVAEPVWQAQRHHDCIRAAQEFADRRLRTSTLRDVGPVDLDLPLKLCDARIYRLSPVVTRGPGIIGLYPIRLPSPWSATMEW
jgi:hypothetical protein